MVLFAQEANDVARAVVDHLQAHRFAVLAFWQNTSQDITQAFHFLLVVEQVAVHGDPELVAALDLEPGEQVLEVVVDDRGQEDVTVALVADLVRQTYDAGQGARRGDDGILGAPAIGILAGELDHEVEALVLHARERMAAVESERRENGQDIAAEILADPLSLGLVPLVAAQKADVARPQRGQHASLQQSILEFDDGVRLPGDFREDLLGGQAFAALRFGAVLDQLVQGGDPHLEELVQVAACDAQEAQALQHRGALVRPLHDDPQVELQLRDFATVIALD